MNLSEKSNKGYSIVSLMVTITIIGILSAIFIPSYISAREEQLTDMDESIIDSLGTTIENVMRSPKYSDDNDVLLWGKDVDYDATTGEPTNPDVIKFIVSSGEIQEDENDSKYDYIIEAVETLWFSDGTSSLSSQKYRNCKLSYTIKGNAKNRLVNVTVTVYDEDDVEIERD